MKKLIIIPAYNEANNLTKLIESINEYAPSFDYIIINDCSLDNTKQLCHDMRYKVLNLPINLGIGGAVQTGFKYAYNNGFDFAVQVDGDGQHDPAFLQTMYNELIENNCNMIIGSRFINNEGFQSSGVRRAGIKFFTFFIKLLTGHTITDPTSGLRMVDSSIIKLFAMDYPKDYPEPESVVAILCQKFNVCEIPVIMKERQSGVSSISIKNSIYYMVKVSLAMLIERIRGYRSAL